MPVTSNNGSQTLRRALWSVQNWAYKKNTRETTLETNNNSYTGCIRFCSGHTDHAIISLHSYIGFPNLVYAVIRVF